MKPGHSWLQPSQYVSIPGLLCPWPLLIQYLGTGGIAFHKFDGLIRECFLGNDLWGKLRHANRAAYADLVATDETRKSIYISVVAQVAELYFQLRGLDERLELHAEPMTHERIFAHHHLAF